jgi:hypothetical protein
MEVSANVRRAEPTPRREQDGETYNAATRSRSTSTQPIAAPSTATHTSCSRIARATRSAALRVAQPSACSLDIAGTASARMARRRILASASSSAASARRICIKSLPRGLTAAFTGRERATRARGPVQREVRGHWKALWFLAAGAFHRSVSAIAPAATRPTPLTARPTRVPRKVVFSSRTKTASAATHATFITPPTNKRPISAQQQPTQ